MRLIKNRKGIEFTVTFLVSLILAVAVLGASLVLVNQFFSAAHREKASIDAQTESQIMSMLAGGSKVAIPVNTVETKIGKLATFGVGILNVLREQTGPDADQDTFTIIADYCTPPLSSDAMLTPPSQDVIVKKNNRNIFLIAYKIPPGSSGTYICNINVEVNGENYAEPVYKAYIKLPSDAEVPPPPPKPHIRGSPPILLSS
jgi:hypothetical protein